MGKKIWLMVPAVVGVLALVAIILLNLASPPGVAPQERQLALKGYVVMVLRDENGNEERREFANAIVDAGFDGIAAAVGDSSANRPTAFDYIAVGTDGTAVASGNTGLGAEILRKKGTYAHTTGTKVWTIKATFAPGEATGGIQESGVLNAATAGTLLARQTFAVVNKGAADTLEITWTFTLSQG